MNEFLKRNAQKKIETVNRKSGEQTFLFLSDAESFRRKKQREGYRTRINHYLGIASPYRVVKYF